MGALRNLIASSNRLGCANIINGYFQLIFQKVFECMYREDIHHANELQNVSDAINDIADYCDYENLRPNLTEILVAVLNELSKSLDPVNFPLK